MELARKVVEKMITGDAFSQWLGIEILEITKGYCKLKMIVRKEMTNGFDIAHGGISYSLADSALAFAANSDGIQSLSVETSIAHTKKVMSGDTLIAETQEVSKNDKSAVYNINITNQDNIEVAHFQGKVYRTKREWFPNN
ncbi:MAG: thioesterase [Cryomorphaceae bacterium BACL11 MAG-121001-bin54]|jgi:acyl-CoA thioesterase|nr:MAG: thioesterase [Cryomorphaceae bacterium BACL11 MAG-121001-bin54]KRO68380.1 MAG: thioesterase [Cryomorphaceae bacterium BACL11 MAG-121128-bin16]